MIWVPLRGGDTGPCSPPAPQPHPGVSPGPQRGWDRRGQRGHTWNSCASCGRVASSRSKRWPLRANVTHASSSAGRSPPCTVLHEGTCWGHAGDTGPAGDALRPGAPYLSPMSTSQKKPSSVARAPQNVAPKSCWAAAPRTQAPESQNACGGDIGDIGDVGGHPGRCVTPGLTVRPSGEEKSSSSRSASPSRGRSRSCRVPFTRATSAASARPPLRGHGDTPGTLGDVWGGARGHVGAFGGTLGTLWGCLEDPGDTREAVRTPRGRWGLCVDAVRSQCGHGGDPGDPVQTPLGPQGQGGDPVGTSGRSRGHHGDPGDPVQTLCGPCEVTVGTPWGPDGDGGETVGTLGTMCGS